jgi:hypothetical protein
VTNWQDDKRWSDQFLLEIKSVLGVYLIGEPPMEEDVERNTDLMVLRMDAVRVGCRIRKHRYAASYGGQFTIRAGRPSGAKTELTKIIEGWGDYFFYGFCDPAEQRLSAWLLGDMRVFRLWYARELAKCNAGKLPGMSRNNADGSSAFAAFNISDLPPQFVIARKPYDRKQSV